MDGKRLADVLVRWFVPDCPVFVTEDGAGGTPSKNTFVVRSAEWRKARCGQVSRPISTRQLKRLLALYLGPINLVVFQGP